MVAINQTSKLGHVVSELNATAVTAGPLILNGRFRGSAFSNLAITDPVAIDLFEHSGPVEDLLPTLIEVGARVHNAGMAGMAVSEVQQLLNRTVEQTVQDTATKMGELHRQVDELFAPDGEIETMLKRLSTHAATALQATVQQQGDPNVAGSLLSRLQIVTKQIGDVVTAAQKAIHDDLRATNEKQAQLLARTLRDFENLDPSTALGQAFQGVGRQLTDIYGLIKASQATLAERQRGTQKGLDFEQTVAQTVAFIASAHGDSAERTGARFGHVISNRQPSKRGDVTCTLPIGRRITLEAMDRDGRQLTDRGINEELEEAKQNREAAAAIAVVSSADNSLMCGQPLKMLDETKLIAVLDKDDPNPLALQVAYQLARFQALSSNEQKEAEAVIDIERLQGAVKDINERLTGLDKVHKSITNAIRCDQNAELELRRFEAQVAGAIGEIIAALKAHANDIDLPDIPDDDLLL